MMDKNDCYSSNQSDDEYQYKIKYKRTFNSKLGHSKNAGTTDSTKIGYCLGAYNTEAKNPFDDQFIPEPGVHFETLYDEPVNVKGKGKSCQMVNSFEEMCLPSILLSNIKKLGYKEPLPIQKATFSIIERGFDVIGVAKTGAGKTAAFLIPIVKWIIHKQKEFRSVEPSPYCIVLSPTRELAEQLYNCARAFTYNTSCVPTLSIGGTRRAEDSASLRKGCDICFGTVGRLYDFVVNGVLNLRHVQFIVFDEADSYVECLVSFEEFHKIVVEKCKKSHQTLLFGATEIEEIKNFAMQFLGCTFTEVTVGYPNLVNSHVDQSILPVSEKEKRYLLLRILRQEFRKNSKSRVIVFTNTKRRSTSVACYLSYHKIIAYPVNGNMTTTLRHEALEALIENKCSVLVATDVLARGVNVKNICLIINYDLPLREKCYSYVHRVGRTGRLGNVGKAINFYNRDNDLYVADLLCKWWSNSEPLPDFLQKDAYTMYEFKKCEKNLRELYLRQSSGSVDDTEDTGDESD